MIFGEWEAKIYEMPGIMGYQLWLHQKTPYGIAVLNHEGTVKRVKEGETTDSNDYFALFESKEQMNAIAQAFSSFGVKTMNDHKNEGLLEATKYHLEDMRRLALKGKR